MDLINQLFQTSKKLRLFAKNRLRELEIDLTFDQWSILTPLLTTNGQYQREIAAQTNKDAPTLTRIIDKLCKKGLTERVIDHGDRRKFKIYITTKGQELMDIATPNINEGLRQKLEVLSDQQVTNAVEALSVLGGQLED